MSQAIEHLNSSQQPETPRTKKVYQAPHLHEYGDVRELTQTNATPTIPAVDGGTGANIYAS